MAANLLLICGSIGTKLPFLRLPTLAKANIIVAMQFCLRRADVWSSAICLMDVGISLFERRL
jgi:hypothetical protein